MLRVILAATLILCCSCKKQESKPPDISPDPQNLPPTVQSDRAQLAEDLYGDPLPAGATGRLGSLRMFDRSIRQMLFTASGSQVISTHREGYQVWNLTDGGRGAVLHYEDPGELMAVSPNGKRLATSNDANTELVFWDLESGQSTATIKSSAELVGLCFLDDETILAATARGDIETWQTSSEPDVIKGLFEDVTALACAPKAGWIAVGTKAGEAYAMKVGGNSAIKLGTGEKAIKTIAIASDASAFAFGGADEVIRIWHEAKAGPPVEMQGHERLVIDLAFTPDNSKLYSTGGDWWFRIWDPKTGELLEEMPGIDGLDAQLMALSPDGALIVSWSQHTNARGSEAGRWWLWNAANGSLLLEPERHAKPLRAVQFAPDGKHIATAGEDRRVRVWDAHSTKSVAMLDAAEGSVNDVAFSSDGLYVYSAGVDALLRKWEWASGEESTVFEGVGGAVNRFLISPDSSRVLTGDQIGRVWSWDMASGNKIQAHDRQGYSAIYDLALSPAGKLLAVAGSDRLVRIIDFVSGKEIAELNPGDTAANFAVSFSDDGRFLATAGDAHKIDIWKVEDWSRSATLHGHDGTVRALDFTPDGKRLVSGGNDETLRVWDLASGKALKLLEGHKGAITDLQVSPDGKSIASASRDRSVLLWSMPE